MLDHAGAHGLIAKPFSRNGVVSVLRYITQGICKPPPSASLTPEFTPFPEFKATWAH